MDQYLESKQTSEEEQEGSGSSSNELRHDVVRAAASRKAKVRKYSPEYLQFGFMPCKGNSDQPQFVPMCY